MIRGKIAVDYLRGCRMAVTVFKAASYSLSGLLDRIGNGDIALPDIQRPFVWPNSRVRDLFDSMYKGFPVGYLLFWSTGADAGAKQIGVETKQAAPSLLIVDGQQRLTSLYAVITGATIVKKDYTKGRIQIAFRPKDCKFEVADAAIMNDPEFIDDIAKVYEDDWWGFVNRFLSTLEEHRGVSLDDDEKNLIVGNIDRLKDIQNYPFQAIELDREVNEEHVAEVFVRINSEGVQLNSADFILTLMSVFWEKGRRELEEFSRAAKTPTTAAASPFNHFIAPAPDQMLRTAVGLAFKRGRLRYVYSILRGKDLETGEFSPERRDAQFEQLREAHESTLNLTNWHEYLKCLQQAGFRSGRMISSETAVIYVYIFWLLGRHQYNVDQRRLREVIARWWFMAHTTGRYTSSPETQLESDFNRLSDIADGDADEFCQALDRIVTDTFTNDYWEITLPNRLDTSSAKSPPLSAYWAALNLLDAEMLFSELKVSSMLDPLVTPVKDMERHHLFPKAHLARLGITDYKSVSAIANMAFVDWTQNSEISDQDPQQYWSQMTVGMDPERLKRQTRLHALPVGWEQLGYTEFCDKRRKLIADVIREGFSRLLDGQPIQAAKPSTLRSLIDGGESNVLEFKESARWSHGTASKGKSEQIIVKTLAGFMNNEGGTLLIGVADDGSAVGVGADYATLSKPDRDGYELFLTQLVSDKISGPSAPLCRITFDQLDGSDICRVDVAAAARPVFACPHSSKEQTDFWLRLGNRTDQLRGTDLVGYTDEHWG